MAEQLNDGHYIKAFDLIEKLYSAASSVPSGQMIIDKVESVGMRGAMQQAVADHASMLSPGASEPETKP